MSHSLLSNKILQSDLLRFKKNLIIFVAECEMLYGKRVCTFNLHSLLHVIDNILKSGPLCMTSTFPFEKGIFKMKRTITKTKDVLEQIVKRT